MPATIFHSKDIKESGQCNCGIVTDKMPVFTYMHPETGLEMEFTTTLRDAHGDIIADVSGRHVKIRLGGGQ